MRLPDVKFQRGLQSLLLSLRIHTCLLAADVNSLSTKTQCLSSWGPGTADNCRKQLEIEIQATKYFALFVPVMLGVLR
ncbi:hypothetical protein F5Y01DRAFT_185036 [Xylaria sp. FL0043]|nr:hypothetical protein F5Y01DRAFT_185036 [Xylaria sp. FL0043]